MSNMQMKFPSGLSAATFSSSKMTMRFNAKPCYCNVSEIYIFFSLGKFVCVLPVEYTSFTKKIVKIKSTLWMVI